VTIILDASHSGSGTRDITRFRERCVDFEATSRSRAIAITSTQASPAATDGQPEVAKPPAISD
jgi:hypothetical protein